MAPDLSIVYSALLCLVEEVSLPLAALYTGENILGSINFSPCQEKALSLICTLALKKYSYSDLKSIRGCSFKEYSWQVKQLHSPFYWQASFWHPLQVEFPLWPYGCFSRDIHTTFVKYMASSWKTLETLVLLKVLGIVALKVYKLQFWRQNKIKN